MTADIPRFWTLAEIAEQLGVSVDYVENLCKGPSPELRHNQFGRTKRVPEDAITEYLERTTVQAATGVASLDEHRHRSLRAA